MGKNRKDGLANTSLVSDMLKLSHMSFFTVMGLKINSFILLLLCFLYSADQELNLCTKWRFQNQQELQQMVVVVLGG